MGPGAVSASSDPCLASAAKAAFCGALAAGAVMEIPWNPRRSTLRRGQCRPCGLDCCVAKTRHHCGCYFAQRLAVPRDARCSWAARFLPITLGSFPWSEPHRRLKRSGSRRKKARRGHLRALWGSGLGATRARHFTDQRLLIGSTSRRSAPVNSWRGRPILYSGSPIISFSWAIQPTVRASAKMAVNSDTGMPMARCTMPE